MTKAAHILQRAATWIRIGLFFALGGFVLLIWPNLRAGSRGVMTRVILFALRFTAFWVVVAVLLSQLVPHVLVDSRAGLETLFQVLPATLVAILVLILGSLFVVAQSATATWGTRAPVMLPLDDDIVRTTARPLLLIVACLLLSGQVPDSGQPGEAVTAGVAALTLATIVVLVGAAFMLPALLLRYTAPRAFPQFVVSELDREYEAGTLGLVVFRAAMLGEMLRLSVRRGDSVAVAMTLEAINDFHGAYARARTNDPSVRTYVSDEGSVRSGWLAQDLAAGLVSAGEEAIRRGVVDGNPIARTCAHLADEFDRLGDSEDSVLLINALSELATSHVQITSETLNLFAEPVGQLAWLEAQAEQRESTDVATSALACWALGAAYARYHLGADEHPLQPRSIRAFGMAPPWTEALVRILDDEWCSHWANRLPVEPMPLVEEIFRAAADHAELHGIEPPVLVPPDAAS